MAKLLTTRTGTGFLSKKTSYRPHTFQLDSLKLESFTAGRGVSNDGRVECQIKTCLRLF